LLEWMIWFDRSLSKSFGKEAAQLHLH